LTGWGMRIVEPSARPTLWVDFGAGTAYRLAIRLWGLSTHLCRIAEEP